ncbi:hypothetical protein F9B74_02070 [Pelistega sp. NLN82]|uniref:Uncharacterized protein n=1 Tax=Pelistega ratti TaxID=2652177 RepID=A0A6L9Y465_9BURK|nr:hypothetical protein [Pelistega ratti]NEN75113.1 hypothetical protein [Pelistega ratti]
MKVSFWRILIAYLVTPFFYSAIVYLYFEIIEPSEADAVISLEIGVLLSLLAMIFMSIPAIILSIICWLINKKIKEPKKVALIMFFITIIFLYCFFAILNFKHYEFRVEGLYVFSQMVLFPSALISSLLYYFLNKPKVIKEKG